MTSVAIHENHDGGLMGRDSVRLWLRLLSCSTLVEKRLRRLLVDPFNATLPRFDVMAALERNAEGLTLSELSRALLVSNGNLTGITKTLLREGLVTVTTVPEDRRSSVVNLTPKGLANFQCMATAHHDGVENLFAGLTSAERDQLYDLLGRLKLSIAATPNRPLEKYR